MPGPLAEGHARFEDDCRKCHAPFSKKKQSVLCSACHDKVGGDIAAGAGFHGRIEGITTMECSTCHSDHQGRQADIVGLDRTAFDHGTTDFTLRGAHRDILCTSCHKAGNKFRAAPGQCVDCHGETDPHRGQMGRQCRDCHTESSWSGAKFDHGKATRFALTGKHAKTTCNACHPDARYKNTPNQCSVCHQLDDVHGGDFGAKCETCHQETGWRPATFDHDRDTKFVLRGRHVRTACTDCHDGPLRSVKPGKLCNDCHKTDDIHQGRNGTRCDQCHGQTRWSGSTFSHDKDTKFRLQGTHAKVLCASCHEKSVDQGNPGTACIDCHQSDDVHHGLNGTKCAACHGQTSWKPSTFTHNRDTKFPLHGKHAGVACRACHDKPVTEAKLATECFACHRNDDVHGGKLGQACATCHSESSWTDKVLFDHDLTRFPLIGLHATAPCEQCHMDTSYKGLALDCAACHQAADIHKGSLGDNCSTCHNPNSWSLWRFDHAARTKFPLTGAHDGLECAACHVVSAGAPTTHVRNLPTNCYGCHANDDVHRGSFGRLCERCHVTESFRMIRTVQ
jgi:hypothetical protein